MDTAALLEYSLERAVAYIGDPAPRVYEALFEREPALREMFIGDPLGSVRGEMFHRAIDTLIDVAGEQPYAAGMIAAEWANHRMNGVSVAQFLAFFDTVVLVLRQALGDEWTAAVDGAWRDTLQRIGQITGRMNGQAAHQP